MEIKRSGGVLTISRRRNVDTGDSFTHAVSSSGRGSTRKSGDCPRDSSGREVPARSERLRSSQSVQASQHEHFGREHELTRLDHAAKDLFGVPRMSLAVHA